MLKIRSLLLIIIVVVSGAVIAGYINGRKHRIKLSVPRYTLTHLGTFWEH